MLDEKAYAELEERLAPVDAELRHRYPDEPYVRQPVHTLAVPADLFGPGVLREYGRLVRRTVAEHGPLPFGPEINARVMEKLDREPVEDLRIDFADGYGPRDDAEEDAAARSTANALRSGDRPPFFGLRCKSLAEPTRRRAVRTIDVFLDALGTPPPGFVITVPRVSTAEQVEGLAVLCGRLEAAYGLAADSLRFEIQVETPAALLGTDGTTSVPRLIGVAAGRCVGLLYGIARHRTGLGIVAEPGSVNHPAAEHAKAVLHLAVAGTGIRLSDDASQVLPVGDTAAVQAAWKVHAGQVRRSLQDGFDNGWDLHPAQLPTRFGATFAFFQQAAAAVGDRLDHHLSRPGSAEPATTRALARFLLRGLDCGALEESTLAFDRSILESQ
jgi:citrate lyase beta subunit